MAAIRFAETEGLETTAPYVCDSLDGLLKAMKKASGSGRAIYESPAGVFAAAQETNNKYFLAAVPKVLAEVAAMQERQARGTVREALVEMNEPQLQERTKDFYLLMTRVRSKEKFVGADALASWYQRNFRILTNLIQFIDSPQDRVLVILGRDTFRICAMGLRPARTCNWSRRMITCVRNDPGP